MAIDTGIWLTDELWSLLSVTPTLYNIFLY